MRNPTLQQEIKETNLRIIKNQLRLQQCKEQITPKFLQHKLSWLLLPAASFGLGWILSARLKIKTTIKPIWRVTKAGLLNLLLGKLS